MRFGVSVILSLGLFGLVTGLLAAIPAAPALGYWPLLILLGLASYGAGYAGGFNGRDAFSGLLAGMLATAYLWFLDDSSAWAATVFHAPLLSLNSDEVLLGLSLTLFAFLQGARLGERHGLGRLHGELYAAGHVTEHRGDPAEGWFALTDPHEGAPPHDSDAIR